MVGSGVGVPGGIESRKTINGKLTNRSFQLRNRLNLSHVDRAMRRIKEFWSPPLFVLGDALPIAALPKAPTDGDCLERQPAAIPSPRSRREERASSLGFASRWNALTTKYTREQAPRQFREEISVDSPVGWCLRESLVVTFCLHPEKDSGSSAIRAREFSDAKCTCHLPGREGYALCCIAHALPRTEVCLGASLSLRTRGLRLHTPPQSRRRCRRRAVRPEIV